MGYRLTRKDNGEFVGEFTHNYLAERYARDHGRKCDYSINYYKKEENEFAKEYVSLFDESVRAFEHDFNFDMRHRL